MSEDIAGIEVASGKGFVYTRYLGRRSRRRLRRRCEWTSPQNRRFVTGFGAGQ